MATREDDPPAPRSRPGEERLLVIDEEGQVRPVVVWLLASMAFTAVASLLSWHRAFVIAGGVGVVVSWVLLARERKRQRAAIEARADDDDGPSPRS